jgi:lantibiotic biosynthesis protein
VNSSARHVDRGDFALEFTHALGPSATMIQGRSATFIPAVRDGIARHVDAERRAVGIALLEVVHTPEPEAEGLIGPAARGGPILHLLDDDTPPSRDQVWLRELEVTVDAGRVRLRSSRTGIELSPRIRHAYRLLRDDLPAYRLLWWIQAQDTAALAWSWGPLAGSSHLPRVCWRGSIVAPEQWTIVPSEMSNVVAALASTDDAHVRGAAAELREQTGLPRFAVLVEGDNELPVDFASPASVASVSGRFAACPQLTFVEQLSTPDRLWFSSPLGPVAHQLILPFCRRVASTTEAVPRSARRRTLPVAFHPGSEWSYLKLYCNADEADTVLARVADVLGHNAAVRSWYFLRYDDPGHHLRVRVLGDPSDLLTGVVPTLLAELQPWSTTGRISRVVTDSYRREWRRYGGDLGMLPCEAIFALDSTAVCTALPSISVAEDQRWLFAAMGASRILHETGAMGRERLISARDELARALRLAPSAWTQSAHQARGRTDTMIAWAQGAPLAPSLSRLRDSLAKRDAAMAPHFAELRRAEEIGALEAPLTTIGHSLAHMHVNRVFPRDPQREEAFIYDALRRLVARPGAYPWATSSEAA